METICAPGFPFPFILDSRIDFTKRGAAILVGGTNGAGKTSFLERVLVPKLEGLKKKVLFLGSDHSVATAMLRVWIRLMRKTPNRSNSKTRRHASHILFDPLEAEELSALLAGENGFNVVILDEFTSEISTFIKNIPQSARQDICWIISSHHHEQNLSVYESCWVKPIMVDVSRRELGIWVALRQTV